LRELKLCDGGSQVYLPSNYLSGLYDVTYLARSFIVLEFGTNEQRIEVD